VPHTVAGRAVAGMLMIVGIGFLSILTATVASTFVSADHQREEPASGEILEMLAAASRGAA
jgi:hypothetical protein